jgi:allantoinase
LTGWLELRMPDVIVRNGWVVNADGRRQADIAVVGGRIAEIANALPSGRSEEIDAQGLLVLPGLIDVHLHFNEPGRTGWEGGATGSRALAAGGGTTFFDMPLNSTPCTLNGREVQRKRAALEESSIADFGLWGGLTPDSLPNLAEMAHAGVVGFKAFMCDSGLPEFPCADDRTLLDGMKEAARLGLPVAVHAESEAITQALAQGITGRGVRDFLASRPVAAETEAVGRALRLAQEAGAKLHIVHMSCGAAVALAVEARRQGVDVSIETCPHYLFFDEGDLERIGVDAKCAPPLRPENADLWRALAGGQVDIVGSDHSPSEPSMKNDADFRGSWGGIAGVQSTLAVLLDSGYHERNLALERIVSLVCSTPAERFRIANKGRIEVGYDADLVLVDPDQSFTLASEDLHQRHKRSPYIGSTFRGTVRQTIRRGEAIFADGRIVATTKGRFVCPIS